MSNDLHLDDEARALQDAINSTPEEPGLDTSSGPSGSDTEASIEKPKKSNKAVKIVVGLGGLLLLSMGGAYFAMESGMLDNPQPQQTKRTNAPPPLSDMASAPSVQPTAAEPAQGVVSTPVASSAMQPATNIPSDPFKPVDTSTQSAPVAADPFKSADKPVEQATATTDPFKAQVPTPKVSEPVILEQPKVATLKPSTQATKKEKASTSIKAEKEITSTPVNKVRHNSKKNIEPDNGYVRLF